jgi:hypothetical protein
VTDAAGENPEEIDVNMSSYNFRWGVKLVL